MPKLIYVCSPYRGDVAYNTLVAQMIAREIALCGMVPVVPHLYLPQVLNDDDPGERDMGLEAGLELLRHCDEVWSLDGCNGITDGMAQELAEAQTQSIPIRKVKVCGAVVVLPEVQVDEGTEEETWLEAFARNISEAVDAFFDCLNRRADD